MSSDLHERYRDDLSAFIDGELPASERSALEEHLEGCAECRALEARLRAVDSAVRLHPVGPVPNHTGDIMGRLASERPVVLRRAERFRRIRIAGVAAAATIALLIGSSVPWLREGNVASAAEITGSVREAARSLESYQASYEIVERGWHPDVPVRRFQVEVAFSSPETMSLTIDDETTYPSSIWPRNDVELLADAEGWWIQEPSLCPTDALPICEGTQTDERGVMSRQPFDGTNRLPTDLIVPLETLAASQSFTVIGQTTVAGRDAYELEMEFRDALPFVTAIQAGGSWREFNPTDRVRMLIDAESWFPLKVSVTPRSAQRPALTVSAVTLDDDPPADLTNPGVPLAETLRDGGWSPQDPESLDVPAPEYLAGLEPYRAGTTSTGREVLTYARGLTWLKVTCVQGRLDSYPLTAEPVQLSGGRPAYYLPADSDLRRRVDIFTEDEHLFIESNLPREVLIDVVGSISVETVEGPDPKRASVVTVDEALDLPFTQAPSYLPDGYRASAAYLAPDGSSVVVYRRPQIEFDGLGIELVQSDAVAFLPASSLDFETIRIDGSLARWSPEAGELQWIDGDVYRSITAPSLDLGTVAAIAEGLR